MASGFVSGGTVDQTVERDDEWLIAQKEIEESRRRKEEEGRQEGGKTLFEVLQQNKAAKQEAFEESIRLKNQFRNLDEDEVEFLDSVLESTRAKEDAVKREILEQLEIFRRQQEEADSALLAESAALDDTIHPKLSSSHTAEESQWAINARKRKRVKDKDGLKGVKARKVSISEEAPGSQKGLLHGSPNTQKTSRTFLSEVKIFEIPQSGTGSRLPEDSSAPKQGSKPAENKSVVGGANTQKPGGLPGLGLGGYESDDDDS